MLCAIAGVSRAGYYKWRAQKDLPPRDHADFLLVKGVFDSLRGRCGWRTVCMRLAADGVVMNHKKVSRIMRDHGLVARVRRLNPYRAMMRKTLEHRTFANALDRRFEQATPGAVVCTDITYLPYGGGLAYLSAAKDVASREIVGWRVSRSLRLGIALGTLDDIRGNVPDGALLHSDQGFHYTSPEFVRRAREVGLTQSMSRKGNCVDNAPIESFFGHLKDEVDYKGCATFGELERLTADYITHYNLTRRQWNLGGLTPREYREHLLQKGG
jgi:transposase InsO family protein